jgi:hypothetical protein
MYSFGTVGVIDKVRRYNRKKGPKVLRAVAVKRIAFVLSMIVLSCEFSKEIIICPLNRVHPAKKAVEQEA